MRRSRLTFYVLLFTLFLATGLRFFRIDYQSYWNDEGNSRALAGYSVRDIVLSAAVDIHPPGYYILLKAWRSAVGESELALRGFSALAGVVLVALLYRLGREYFNQRVGVLAALLGAVNSFLIYYSQEARMYSLLATLGAASFLLFSLWLKATRPSPHPRPLPIGKSTDGEGSRSLPHFRFWKIGEGWGGGLALGYCAITAAGLYTHYAFPFVIIAQNLAAVGGLLFHRRGNGPRRLAVWFGIQFITLLLFTPWLPIAYRQLTAWPAAREFHTFTTAVLDVMRYLMLGRTIETSAVTWAVVVGGVVLALGLLRGGQTITPFLWLGVPVGLTLAFGLLTEAFSKFLLTAVPALCLLLGNGLAGGKWQGANGKWSVASALRFTFHVLLGLTLLYATALSLNNLYFNPAYFRDDYRGIALHIENQARFGLAADDAIITISPNQVQAFEYYHRAGAPVFPMPIARPPDVAKTTQALADIAQTHTRLFVLFWGEGQADPAQVVERWLGENTFKAGDQWFGQVRLATYGTATSLPTPTPSGAHFGSGIVLEEFVLPTHTFAPGDILPLMLHWRTDKPVQARYKVFVHLSATFDLPPVAQQDGEPGGGWHTTDGWQVGERVNDPHGVPLPTDLPPGQYAVIIGLYNLFEGTRLPVIISGTETGDRLELGIITVSK